MPGPAPIPISLTPSQRDNLEKITRRTTGPQREVTRANIILACDDGHSNSEVSEQLGLARNTVRHWRKRFSESIESLGEMESKDEWKDWKNRIHELLADAPRAGVTPKFSAEEVCQIIAVACEPPDGDSQRPISHWTARELRDEVVRREIVENISVRQVGRFFKRSRLQAALEPVLAEFESQGSKSL